jgi:hypothetical protein
MSTLDARISTLYILRHEQECKDFSLEDGHFVKVAFEIKRDRDGDSGIDETCLTICTSI